MWRIFCEPMPSSSQTSRHAQERLLLNYQTKPLAQQRLQMKMWTCCQLSRIREARPNSRLSPAGRILQRLHWLRHGLSSATHCLMLGPLEY
jgi:hypothetical protein